MARSCLAVLAGLCFLTACAGPSEPKEPMGVLPSAVTSAEPLWIPFAFQAGKSVVPEVRERRLSEIRQLTFDGRSGRASFRPDGQAIVFERRDEAGCGRIVSLSLGSGASEEVTREGCAFSPGYLGETLLFTFTPEAGRCTPAWLEEPAPGCALVGKNLAPLAPKSGGYDVEPFAARAVVFFTSNRDNDPELYRFEGGAALRVTSLPGYDGGATLSPDGTRLAWHHRGRRFVPEGGEAPAGPRPGPAIYLAGERGQHPRMVADLGPLNVDPVFLSDSRRILFASSYDAITPGADDLELYLVDPEGPATAGGGPRFERVTFSPGYDGEPRLSPDGRHLLFTSSRGGGPGSRNVFVARFDDSE